jgi:hypothetical protein
VGCEKKSEDKQSAKIPGVKIPTVAPKAAKVPGAVLENIQYAMLRKDPKFLESFFIDPENKAYSSLASTQWFHSHAGGMGLALTQDEINTLGLQELAEKGYISERWTSREYKKIRDEIDAGVRQDYEPGMEKVDERKLDMPIFTDQMNKKLLETLNDQLKEALEKNPKAAFAAGLYRCFKAIPPEGWPHITAVIGPNAAGDKHLNDLALKADDELLATLSVGSNPDETMFICYIQVKKYPASIAKLFGVTQEPAK